MIARDIPQNQTPLTNYEVCSKNPICLLRTQTRQVPGTHTAFGAPHPLGRRTTSRRAVLFRITVCKSSFALRPHPWQRIVIIATDTPPYPRLSVH